MTPGVTWYRGSDKKHQTKAVQRSLKKMCISVKAFFVSDVFFSFSARTFRHPNYVILP